MMWIDVVESGDWIRQLYDVVPPLEHIACNFMFVDEGGGSIELRMVLPVPVDHSAVRGRGGDGIILVLVFHGVRSFRMRMVGKRMISSAQLERVDGQVVFHGYGEQVDCTIVADSVSVGK
ncbi:hypothetical protein GCM10007377_08280 [Galliscardovia ingluviei]|uniref:Uncharacterized protein n=1 Tax=Galliscardovia ingluviei TaxID=1769422 RepID=A0A8J3AGB9_9BIFI|nr:hypothetical protein [Galliscardovia ingluviei]GGI13902.1 hypothetical protein GCM10007377_08280 [Galliscardovia ingluviei]